MKEIEASSYEEWCEKQELLKKLRREYVTATANSDYENTIKELEEIIVKKNEKIESLRNRSTELLQANTTLYCRINSVEHQLQNSIKRSSVTVKI